MADRKILDNINLNTATFKKGLKEQLKVLEKLKDMGDTLQELTDEADPMQESIKGTLAAIDGIVGVIDSLEKMPIPKV